MATSFSMPHLFCDWYDSVKQRDMVIRTRDSDSDTLRSHILGRIRWDAIQSPSRVQTYTQLLDGWAMRLFPGDRLIEEIGLNLNGSLTFPFTVTNSGSSITQSLYNMARHGFMFSSIGGEETLRLEIQARMADLYQQNIEHLFATATATDDHQITTYGLKQILRDILRDQGRLDDKRETELANLANSWNFWIQAEKDGRLNTRPTRRFRGDAAAIERLEFNDLENQLLTTRARFILREKIMSDALRDPDTGLLRRGLAYAEISRLDRYGNSDERKDKALLKREIDLSYHKAIAESENAALSITGERSQEKIYFRRLAEYRSEVGRTVVFPSGYMDILGGMSDSEWRHFVDADVRFELQDWWNRKDADALQEIGNRLAAFRHSSQETSRALSSVKVSWVVAAEVAGVYLDPTLPHLILGGILGLITCIVTGQPARNAQRWVGPFELAEIWTHP